MAFSSACGDRGVFGASRHLKSNLKVFAKRSPLRPFCLLNPRRSSTNQQARLKALSSLNQVGGKKQTNPLFDVGDEITRVALSTNWMQAINTFDFTNFSQIPHKSIAGFRKAHFTNVV
ncbi:hypothetical protein [Bradyrhizobium zhanjiangense]|uniref:hypothetical protein n=1 Tax=Bradyrhizobium zhanjiangense TaxID=1325107 RepID=UPI0010093C9E|nr:hypothetical protein [Bradyrhizobium zhanjiangense]